MKRLLDVDPVSLTATLEPGLRGPEAEALLAAHGLTLGHFPQSYEFATIGGFAATRSSGQASAGYGRFDDMVVGLTARHPGRELRLGRAPASAAGPDLRQLLLGSEGAFGVITAVTVRVRRAPARPVDEGWRLPPSPTAPTALRTLAQDGLLPTVLRLSDETETASASPSPSRSARQPARPRGCLCRRLRGDRRSDAARARRPRAVLAGSAAPRSARNPASAGPHGRYAAPYLRDSLLDAGRSPRPWRPRPSGPAAGGCTRPCAPR